MGDIVREILSIFDLTGSEELDILTEHAADNPEQRYLVEQYLDHIEFRENFIIFGSLASIVLAITFTGLVSLKMVKFRAKIAKIEERKL